MPGSHRYMASRINTNSRYPSRIASMTAPTSSATAVKEEQQMITVGFVRNNQGISEGQALPEEFKKKTSLSDQIKTNPL